MINDELFPIDFQTVSVIEDCISKREMINLYIVLSYRITFFSNGSNTNFFIIAKNGLLNRYRVIRSFFLFYNSYSYQFFDTVMLRWKTKRISKSIPKDNRYDLQLSKPYSLIPIIDIKGLKSDKTSPSNAIKPSFDRFRL